MSGAPARLPHGRAAAVLNSTLVCPRAAGTRLPPGAARKRHANFHAPPPAQASWPAGSHCVARPPQAMPAFPVRPQGGSPFQCYGARSCVACVIAVRRLRRTRQRKGAVCKRCKPPCRLAPHLRSVSLHRRQGQALRALRGLDGAGAGDMRPARIASGPAAPAHPLGQAEQAIGMPSTTGIGKNRWVTGTAKTTRLELRKVP